MEELNFVSLPLAALLALVGGPVLLRRAGYPAGKMVCGTLTGLVVLPFVAVSLVPAWRAATRDPLASLRGLT